MTFHAHMLNEVGQFEAREADGSPYFRWYCSCHAIGSRRGSKKAAVADWNTHVRNIAYIDAQERSQAPLRSSE